MPVVMLKVLRPVPARSPSSDADEDKEKAETDGRENNAAFEKAFVANHLVENEGG